MDLEDDSSESDTGSPKIFGLEAFDLDFQYAMYGPSFGLQTPSYEIGAKRLVSQREMNELFSGLHMQLYMYLALVIYSAFNTVVFRLLNWLAGTEFLLFRWWNYLPGSKAILVHAFLVFCADQGLMKDFVVGTLQRLCATRWNGQEENDRRYVRKLQALLSYGVGSLMSHNIRSILRFTFRPLVLLPIGLLGLYALGIFRMAYHQCQSLIVVVRERIWMVATYARHRVYTAHQEFAQHHYPHDAVDLYKYTKPRPSEFRLVELRRSHPFAGLSARLLTYALSSAPPYEAISYTWGDVTTNHTLLIDGCSLPITRNAFMALHAIAPFWGSRLVWMDSVCINQQDNQDKNHQVALMAKIYERATRTLSWIGDSANAERAVLQLYRLQPALITKQMCEEVIEMMKLRVCGIETSPTWSAVFELLSHQYWTRMWIIQELAVSKEAHILYGTHYIPLTIISKAAGALSSILDEYNKGEHYQLSQGFDRSSQRIRPPQKIEQDVLNLRNIRVMNEFRDKIQKGRYPEFWAAVVATYLFNATDPRDKIYALYNIATFSADSGLSADYTTSVNDVYTRFTKHYIARNFQNVFFAAVNYRPHQLPGLPSWVPDFTSKSTLQLAVHSAESRLTTVYNASGEHDQGAITYISSNKIRLRGVYVDEITHISSHAIGPSKNEVSDPTMSPEMHAWHQEAVALVVAHTPPQYRSYGESRRQALIRTLIEDRNSDGAEAERFYRRYYKHWSRLLELSASEADSGLSGNALDPPVLPQNEHVDAEIYASAVLRSGRSSRFGVTKEGFMARVPREVQVGDVVWVLAGLQVPVVLRSIEKDGGTGESVYGIVGWCYCHGVMMGEAVVSGEWGHVVVR